ncbi:galectin-9C-like isoform X2 [Neocloeon triangulifer]|uniref:galectin-9C-like isoform X2 n=1 Tax=Neocloeon triangulifer TaxID=2078957 RepID=UPI00286F6D26|nr:galectin-9C-like isoform X2 [Neocloeon triangulifer]
MRKNGKNAVPYTSALHAPLASGHMIVLDGEVKPGAQRFNVDLICGLSVKSDVALHVNPRFDEMRLVRNTRHNERWGEEESVVPFKLPLKRGEPFYMYIFVAESKFLIAIDGRHMCSYQFRMPLIRISGIHVEGDIKLFQLEHRRNLTEYPMPSCAIAAASLPIPTRSCPANLSTFCSHIVGPGTPFLGDIPEGLAIGHQVEVKGKVKVLPHSFAVNLQRGKTVWPQPPIILHINPRFKEGHIIVRNALLKGCWGNEERSGGCPLKPGQPFHLVIRCESKQFNIAINGIAFATFKYRHPIEDVDTILVEGDVKVSDIYIR